MTEILRFLIEHLAFLYAPDRLRFVNSRTTASFGGDAFLDLESEALRLRLVSDRGQLFMDFQAIEQHGERDWYSIDVVRELLTGEPQASAELSPDYAEFLEHHLAEIERRFAGDALPATASALKDLERARAKRLFD